MRSTILSLIVVALVFGGLLACLYATVSLLDVPVPVILVPM